MSKTPIMDEFNVRDLAVLNGTVEPKTPLYDQMEMRKIALEKMMQPTLCFVEKIRYFSDKIYCCLDRGNTVYVAGNGGSAADAQHFAGEMVGSFLIRNRIPLSLISLCSDTAVMTAIANDYGYEQVFSRQFQAHAKPGDLFFGITTSETSPNILNALEEASDPRFEALLLTSINLEDHLECIESGNVLRVPSKSTPIIQELHKMVIHMICSKIDHLMTR